MIFKARSAGDFATHAIWRCLCQGRANSGVDFCFGHLLVLNQMFLGLGRSLVVAIQIYFWKKSLSLGNDLPI